MNECQSMHADLRALVSVCMTKWWIEGWSHLFDCLKPLREVLFEARVNLRQPETSQIRSEMEKALLAVPDDSNLPINRQGRRHGDKEIHPIIVKKFL